MTIQNNQIKYPLSTACYNHSKYFEFLEKADLSHTQKAQIYEIHAKFMRGTRLNKEQQDFIQSIEYNHIVHSLDVAGGEYPKLLKATAKKLFIKKYSMQECDFDAPKSQLNMVGLYIDFHEQSQEFSTWDTAKKVFHYLTIEEVESEYFSSTGNK